MSLVLLYYFLFALTTAIYAHLFVVRPVINDIRDVYPDNNAGTYYICSYLVFLSLNTIFAPFVFFAMFFVSGGQTVMRDSLFTSLTKKI